MVNVRQNNSLRGKVKVEHMSGYKFEAELMSGDKFEAEQKSSGICSGE